MGNETVTDKGCVQSGISQMVGRDQLGQLQLDVGIRSSFLKQLLCTVMEVIAGIQQKEINIPKSFQQNTGAICLQMPLVKNILRIETVIL